MIEVNQKFRRLKESLGFAAHLRMPKPGVRLTFLVLAAVAALIEFSALGLARRTFVFYTVDKGLVTVENRMLHFSKGNALVNLFAPQPASRELDITRYVEEALLGPVSPDSMPLFPKETRLRSLLYRDGTVYIDLSGEAVLPPQEGSHVGGEVLQNLQTLYSGVRRNFSFVKDVRFFIAGKAAFASEFRQADRFADKSEQW